MRQLQHAIPTRHRHVVEVRLVDHHRSVERPRDEHRVHRRAGTGGAVEELLRGFPRGGGRVGFVATAEPLDHDRETADLRELDQVVLVSGVEPADRALREKRDRPRARAPGLVREREEFLATGDARRHGTVVEVEVRRCRRRRHARRARAHCLRDERAHLLDLVGRRGALRRVGAHYPPAEVRVTHVAREVHAEASRAAREEFGKRHELVPGDRAQRDRMHVLDPSEDAREELTVFRLARRDREPAVPGDDRGDAVEA